MALVITEVTLKVLATTNTIIDSDIENVEILGSNPHGHELDEIVDPYLYDLFKPGHTIDIPSPVSAFAGNRFVINGKFVKGMVQDYTIHVGPDEHNIYYVAISFIRTVQANGRVLTPDDIEDKQVQFEKPDTEEQLTQFFDLLREELFKVERNSGENE